MASLQAELEGSELIAVVAEDGQTETDSNSPDIEIEMVETNRIAPAKEIDFFIGHGLGLGVDATDPEHWWNIKPFKVRNVTSEDILVINGGVYRGFVNEVTNTQQFHAHVTASVPTTTLVSVGIEAEGSQTYSIRKKYVGKKIVSRTVSFKGKLEDVFLGRIQGDCNEEELTLEQELTKWIKDHTKKANLESVRQGDLVKYCSEFINSHSITHYVYSIDLGACYYRSMSEEECKTIFGAGMNVEMDQIAEIAIKNTASFGEHTFQNAVTKIGRLKEGGDDHDQEVERENVVGVKLQSISSLVVHSTNLKLAMDEALSRFIYERQNRKFGPFFICCGNHKEKLYLQVDDSKDQLIATNELNSASQFYIIRCDQGDEHFRIIYKPPILLESSVTVRVVPNLYLCTSQSKKNEPLMMKDTASNSKMALRSRKIDHYQQPAELKEWVSCEDAFFIICQERSVINRHRGYLCVYKPKARRDLESPGYITGCKPKNDRNKPDIHMLFRLMDPPAEIRDCPKEIKCSKIIESKGKRNESSNGEGPFCIATNFGSSKENVYFSVDNFNVKATTDATKASWFDIKREDNYFRMNLCSEPSLHLTAVVNRHGYSDGNLRLQLQSDTTGARSCGYFTICDSNSQNESVAEAIEDHDEDPELEKWFDGSEMFYIRCSAKPSTSGKPSYLCVQQKAHCFKQEFTYSTGCVPSIKPANNQGRAMLFKVIKVTEKENGDIRNSSRSKRLVTLDGEN